MSRSIRQIVLTGFMGTGKSTVGRILSRHFCAPFYDIDRLIEENQKMAIADIFEKKGEPYFRDLEQNIIRGLVSRPAELKIISTGGGALLSDANVQNLKKEGILICLTADADTILKRVRHVMDRPLLNVRNRREEIIRLLEIRESRYRETGDFLINTAGSTPEEISDRIISEIPLDAPRLPFSIEVPLGDYRYPILLGMGSISGVGEYLGKAVASRKVTVVSNPLVWKLHGLPLLQSLKQGGFHPVVVRVPDGETTKSLRWANHIIGEMLRNRMERSSPVIAFGGGVIGDLAGFVSGVYLRGTPFVQIPTTLIAQVDSSIGGKTGVNHPLGKNLIGLFHQPRFVWIDTDLLQTLKVRDYISGLAEVVKYGMIYDEALFDFMESNHDTIRLRDPGALFHLVKRSCEIKAEVVGKDERETGLRKILNYGHTLGHAVEAATAYKIFRHGEAISIGMDFAARLSERHFGLPNNIVGRQKSLLTSLGLPSKIPRLKPSDLMGCMLLDKKVSSGKIYFILPEKIGKVRIEPVPGPQIETEIRRGLSGK